MGEADIAAGHVLVATGANDLARGVAVVRPSADGADLEALFVDPPAIGQGVGRALFHAAGARARRWGARRLTVLADPNAATFYERLGARWLRNAPSDAIPGRSLPLYEYDLTSGVQT